MPVSDQSLPVSRRAHTTTCDNSDVNAAERVAGLIDASPTPFHAVATAVDLLESAGGRVPESSLEAVSPGLWYLAQDGALVAWLVGAHHGPRTGLRIVGAHTDSPNLRLKPQPDRDRLGYGRLGVEVYGSPLLNSWLDRDLGVAGRLAVRDSVGGIRSQLVRIDEPLLRIPQLAIHLDRDVNSKGLVLNPERHLSPIWGVDPAIWESEADSASAAASGGFLGFVAETCGIDIDDVFGHELMVFDLQPSRLIGHDRQLLSAPRIDNLVSCFTATLALAALATEDSENPHIAAVCLFDHEEIGSVSTTGADSPWLQRMLEVIVEGFAAGCQPCIDDIAASRADSCVLSADGAHATHPNYPERHDQQHQVVLNGGPVLKSNANQRYATNALTGAYFALACEQAGVPMQRFVSRSDMPCGSTIGPITAAKLGIATVDAGCAQLAMHSAREVCGAKDIRWFQQAIKHFLSG